MTLYPCHDFPEEKDGDRTVRQINVDSDRQKDRHKQAERERERERETDRQTDRQTDIKTDRQR